jgi:hypothetical protein
LMNLAGSEKNLRVDTMHSPIPIVDNNDSPLLILESLKTN